MRRFLITVVFLILGLFIFVGHSYAITFDLLAPSGELERGQDVRFTVNIDTEEKSLTSTRIGMTFDTQFLEYVSVSPGTTFSTVSADVQEEGKIVITGSSADGFSGTGSFAIVTFRIIAQEPGSTELCALFNPADPTSTPAIPNTIAPTKLPRSGSASATGKGAILGVMMVFVAIASFVVFKKI